MDLGISGTGAKVPPVGRARPPQQPRVSGAAAGNAVQARRPPAMVRGAGR